MRETELLLSMAVACGGCVLKTAKEGSYSCVRRVG